MPDVVRGKDGVHKHMYNRMHHDADFLQSYLYGSRGAQSSLQARLKKAINKLFPVPKANTGCKDMQKKHH